MKRMKRRTKIWYGIGVASVIMTAAEIAGRDNPLSPFNMLSGARAETTEGEGGEGGEQAPSIPPVNEYPGNFDEALKKAFGGEGGERGVGMSKMWPRIWIPALTGDQVKKVVTGNTLRNDDKIALHFDETGHADGWYVDWEIVDDVSLCPQKVWEKGDDWALEEGVCWRKDIHETAGSWEIRDHKICTSLRDKAFDKELWHGAEKCWNAALVGGLIAIFDETGTIEGKLKYLKHGRVLGLMADND